MLRLNIAIAVAPALFLLWLFKKWDEKRPEPPGAVRNCVLFGVACCVPAIGIELGESYALGKEMLTMQGGFLNAYFVAALTEEALKLAVVLIFLWRKAYFDEVMDGILYTAAASLGFAMIENVLYSAANPLTGLMRAFTAVPLHAVASGIMGYFVGRAKFAKGAGTLVWLVMGLSAAVFIHGTYDWVLMSQGGFGFEPNPAMQFSILGIVLVCGLILWMLVRHALKLDDAMLGSHARPLTTDSPPQAQPIYPGQPQYAPQYAPAGGYGAPAQAYAGAPVGYAPAPQYAQQALPQVPYGAPAPYGAPPPYGQPPQAQPYAPQPYPHQQQQQQQAYAPPQQYAQQQPYAPPQGYAQPQYAPPTQPQPFAPPPNPYDPRNPNGGNQGGNNR